MSDLRPAGPQPPSAPATVTPIKPSRANDKPSAPRGRIAIGALMGSSLKSLRPLWIVVALPGAALVATGAILAVWSYYYLRSGMDMSLVSLNLRERIELIAAVGLVLGGWAWLRLVRAAVIFQRAGANDHRLAEFGVAWHAAMARTGRLVSLRLRHALVVAAELMLLGGIIWYGGRLDGLPVWAQISLIFGGCLGVLYLLASLWVVHRLIEAGIILSGLRISSSHRLGLKLWRRHWELLGLRLAALIVYAALGLAAAYGVFLGVHSLNTSLQLSLSAAALTIGIAVVTVISGGATEATYRQLIKLDVPDRASKLLGARRPLKVSAVSALILFLGLALPLGAAVGSLIYLH